MKSRSRGNSWLLGLTIGLVFGVASLSAGMPAWILGIAALAMLAKDRARTTLIGGALVGFGASWTTVLLLADWRCQEGCTGPDLTPWFVIGVAAVLAGVGLSVWCRHAAAV
jgi:hypothetical protein